MDVSVRERTPKLPDRLLGADHYPAASCRHMLSVSAGPYRRNNKDTPMTTIHWTNDFKAACAQADVDHKLVLLDFFSPT
jgi:hypothetical protein